MNVLLLVLWQCLSIQALDDPPCFACPEYNSNPDINMFTSVAFNVSGLPAGVEFICEQLGDGVLGDLSPSLVVQESSCEAVQSQVLETCGCTEPPLPTTPRPCPFCRDGGYGPDNGEIITLPNYSASCNDIYYGVIQLETVLQDNNLTCNEWQRMAQDQCVCLDRCGPLCPGGDVPANLDAEVFFTVTGTYTCRQMYALGDLAPSKFGLTCEEIAQIAQEECACPTFSPTTMPTTTSSTISPTTSSQPSMEPSCSSVPSMDPTVSLAPSTVPSVSSVPSTAPSFSPSVSSVPSLTPSATPSHSSAPSSTSPSVWPSVTPTRTTAPTSSSSARPLPCMILWLVLLCVWG